MPRTETVTDQCPECDREVSVELWGNIHTRKNPEARDLIFSNRINRFRCACGFEILYPTSITYHDQDRRFVVQYFVPDAILDKDFMSMFTRHGKIMMPDPGPELSYLLDAHFVFQFEELKRYILFREKLHDAPDQNVEGAPSP